MRIDDEVNSSPSDFLHPTERISSGIGHLDRIVQDVFDAGRGVVGLGTKSLEDSPPGVTALFGHNRRNLTDLNRQARNVIAQAPAPLQATVDGGLWGCLAGVVGLQSMLLVTAPMIVAGPIGAVAALGACAWVGVQRYEKVNAATARAKTVIRVKQVRDLIEAGHRSDDVFAAINALSGAEFEPRQGPRDPIGGVCEKGA